MNNYRALFSVISSDNVSYENKANPNSPTPYKNFLDLPTIYKPILTKIFSKANQLGITKIWYFLEPDLELTWLTDNPKASEKLRVYCRRLCRTNKGINFRYLTYKDDPRLMDWFCKNEIERQFGANRHDICRKFIQNYWENQESVDKGWGINNQIARTIHTLCNPLGINFRDEGKLCVRHGFRCLMLGYLPYSFCKFIFRFLKWHV